MLHKSPTMISIMITSLFHYFSSQEPLLIEIRSKALVLESRKHNRITHFHYHRFKYYLVVISDSMQRTDFSLFSWHTWNILRETAF